MYKSIKKMLKKEAPVVEPVKDKYVQLFEDQCKAVANFPEDAPYYVKYDPDVERPDLPDYLYTQYHSMRAVDLLVLFTKIGTFDPKTLCFIKDGYIIGHLVGGYNRSEMLIETSRKLEADYLAVKLKN
jgi:hypothetical protein